MKRLLIYVILMLVLTGCVSQKQGSITTQPQTEASSEAVSLTMERLEQGEFISVTAKWSNATSETYTYGETFVLQYLSQDQWTDVPMRENFGFHMIAYSLEPGSEREMTYHITPAFRVTEAGQYRICTEAIDAEDQPVMLYLPFTLDAPQEESLAYRSWVLRTDVYYEGKIHPHTTVITDRAQLDAYYRENEDCYGFTSGGSYGNSQGISFQKLCERYDDAYFADHYLILTALEAPSGSIRHAVRSVTECAGEICVNIDVIEPFCGTSDMANWHCIVELEKGDYLPAVTVSTENRKSWVYNDLAGDCVYTSLPALYLQGDGVFYPTQTGSRAWNYTQDLYQWNNINACGSHPFSVSELPMPLYFENSMVYLHFEESQYHAVTVKALPIAQWGTSTQGQELAVENGVFRLLPGANLYWVSARWEQTENCLFHGGGDYIFYAIAPEENG